MAPFFVTRLGWYIKESAARQPSLVILTPDLIRGKDLGTLKLNFLRALGEFELIGGAVGELSEEAVEKPGQGHQRNKEHKT